MNFEVKRDNLAKALSVSNKAISAKASLPILQNVLIDVDEGRLKLVSSDLEKSIVTWVGAKVSGDSSITIPAKLFYNYVSSLKEERIIGTVNKDKLLLKTKTLNTVFNGTSSDSYPQFSYSLSKKHLTIPGDVLKRSVEETYFSASIDDTRPEWTGVLVEVTEGGLNFVSLDGFRMSKKHVNLKLPNNLSFTKAIVPAKNLLEVIRLASSDSKVKIDFQLDKGNVVFALEDVFFISRLLEGSFPDYNSVIPNNYVCSLEVSYDLFLNALKTASVFSKNSGAVRLKIDQKSQKLTFISDDLELGRNEQVIKVSKIEGEDLDLAFNIKYLLDYLNNVSSEEIILKFSGSSSPALITPKGRSDYIYVLVPVQPYWED